MGRRGNGEGSIFQRKDGRWVGEAFVLLPNGGRDRRTVYGKSREEVVDRVRALLSQAQQGIVAPSRMTVADYLQLWLVDVAKPAVRPSSYRAYEMMVRVHIEPAIGKKRLDRLTAPDIRRLVNAKLHEGMAVSSVRKIHAVLRSALEQAVRDDLLVRNVARLVRVPMPPTSDVRAYDLDEARKLLETAKGDRLHALWAVAMSLGLRKGEALGLRWEDVDLDAGYVRVRQSLQRVNRDEADRTREPELSKTELRFLPPKTARSRRTVPLPPVCLKILREHRAHQAADRLKQGADWHDSGLVFCTSKGTPIQPDNVNRSFNALCDRAGIRRIPVHGLRHTCATLLLAQGVPARVVMEILGHSQISVTMNIYTDVMPTLQQDALNKMDGLFEAEPAPQTERDPGPDAVNGAVKDVDDDSDEAHGS